MNVAGQQREADSAAGSVADAGIDPIAVREESELEDMVADLLAPRRAYAVVAVASSVDGDQPVIAASEIRAVVGPTARVYFVPGEALLGVLRERVGRGLALTLGAVRVWWPGVSRRSDPGDHPLVLSLEGESERDMLAEFSCQFHLSRPDVRREIKQIEDVRALAEHRLAEAEEKDDKTAQRLRDAHRERHREATRADAAEAALQIAQRQLRAACGLGGGGRHLGLRALGGDAAEREGILRAFGENVAVLRAGAGLSPPELAARCLIGAGHVGSIERGERVPSLLVLLGLAAALGVSIEELTDRIPPLTREAGRTRIRGLIAKAPQSRRGAQKLAQASGLPGSYVRQMLLYMQAHGEVVAGGDGWELAAAGLLAEPSQGRG
jgi:transcriptional regulator with XRE-family HTH domain